MTAPLVRDRGVNVRTGERKCSSCGGSGDHHRGQTRYPCVSCDSRGAVLCVCCSQPAVIEHRYRRFRLDMIDHLCETCSQLPEYAGAPMVEAEVE